MINGCFPGASSQTFQSSNPLYSWVVDILPYIDNVELANAWDKTQAYYSTIPAITGNPSNYIIGTRASASSSAPKT